MSKRLAGIVLALGLAFSAGAQAIDSFVFGFSPRTGDGFVDAQLGDINVFASGNKDGFIDDVVVSFGAPRYLVREYYYDRRWAPGDIYYACAIAYQLRRPCVEILDIYERDHGQGWGVIAQRLGIRPGSPEFHALKGKVVGAQSGTTQADYTVASYPDADVRLYPTQDEASLDMASGRIDVMVGDMLPLLDFVEKSEDGKCCKLAGEPITDPAFVGEGVGIALRKENTELRDRLNKALAEIRADGTYKAINDKYFSIDLYTMK